MPSPFPNLPPERRGALHIVQHASAALLGNPWSDPSTRDVHVYEPPGSAGAPLPAVLFLAGYAGTGEKFLARGLSEVSIATRLDRLVASGCPPFRAVLPDVMTRVGGSQYVDSVGLGSYATWLADELPAFVGDRFPTTGWGVVGKSSGGFGALHLALTFPGRFDAVACHSGDLGFDLCYLGDLLPAARAIGPVGLERFVDAFWAKEDPSGNDFAAMNLICMSCAYSPDPAAAPIPARFPVDFRTGAVDFDVIRSWMRLDPLHRDLEPLRALRLLFVDVGDRDEHGLALGARRLRSRLEAAGIAHVYEEFPGGHRGTSHRWDCSLPLVAAALTR